ncbi:uncharacterized protein LOC112577165 isoform X1 [Pomacea canaliculata]|uniref:uncharacterized protein LOC112577165 isoform X1 n=1 Tax=Pomacea canaliculata TaxID=400727 RepID=UPI000D7316CC|nr:uncharacterized protein LOC112577165 isoform X1 [Pomacea canaliculata]
MTTLMPLLSVTGLVLLLLTTAPTSCNSLTPGSHLPPFSRGDVKDEDMSAPGVVIDNVVDVKAEDFVEKDKKADELTESALKDDVLQTLETTGLNADNHDGPPPLQSVEQGTKVTSSRLRRAPKKTGRHRAFDCSFEDRFISPKGKTQCSKRGTLIDAERDLQKLLAEGPSEYNYTLTTTKAGLPAIKAVHLETNKVTMYTYAK